MSLVQQQAAFAQDVIKLLTFVFANGFVATFGEAYRTAEQQAIYIANGASKLKPGQISQHQKRLAIDLNIFKDGKLCTAEQVRVIGKYWESLGMLNRWGGSWRGEVEAGRSHFIDSPHFERMEA